MHEVHAPRARSFAEFPDQDGYIFFPPVGGAPRLHHHPGWNGQQIHAADLTARCAP